MIRSPYEIMHDYIYDKVSRPVVRMIEQEYDIEEKDSAYIYNDEKETIHIQFEYYVSYDIGRTDTIDVYINWDSQIVQVIDNDMEVINEEVSEKFEKKIFGGK